MPHTPERKMLAEILEQFPQADPASEFLGDEINGCEAVEFLAELIPDIRRLLDKDPPPPYDPRTYTALQACWSFIENVSEDDPERSEKFFTLRALVRQVLWNLDPPDTPTPTAYNTSWEYHHHGEHKFFDITAWRTDVAADGTVLGYQAWVWHHLESLLHDVDLVDVDTIEVAGCCEADGVVDVIKETDAEFFSAYTHKQGEGVECVCDFNTKFHALEFARALAHRTGIPVYGNLCAIQP